MSPVAAHRKSVLGWLQGAANVIVSERHCSQPQNGVAANSPRPVPVWAELVPSPALDRAGEAGIRRWHGVGQNVWSGSGWYTFYWHESLLEGRVTPIFI